MNTHRILRLLEGLLVLVTLWLGVHYNPHWLIGTAILGLNQFQSGFTNWYPVTWFLETLGTRRHA